MIKILLPVVAILALLQSSCTEVYHTSIFDRQKTNPVSPIEGEVDIDEVVVDVHAPIITLYGGDTITILRADPAGELDKYLDLSNSHLITVVDPDGGSVQLMADANDVYIFTPTNSESRPPYKIVYTAVDTDGNTATKIRYVIVKSNIPIDTNPPILLIGDDTVYLEVGSPYVEPGATAYDLEEGNSVECTIISTVDVTKAGTYTITYTASDSSGNTATATRCVIVLTVPFIDNTPPVITLKGADTISFTPEQTIEDFKSSWVEPGFIAIDNVDGDITSKVVVSPITILSPYYYYISYYVVDASGNSSKTVKRMIKTGIPVATVPPTIIFVYGDSVIQQRINNPWVEPGFAVIDIDEGTIPNSQVSVDSAELIKNLGVVGIYNVTYSVTNSKGVTGTKIRSVQVVSSGTDLTPPRITLLGRNPDTCLIQTEYKEPGYKAVDMHDGDITSDVRVSGLIDITTPGKYTLTYRVHDAAGNTGLTKRDVWVVTDALSTGIKIRYGAIR